MNFEEKELLSRYPKLFKHGDNIKIKGDKCWCDAADECGNIPGLGFLWVRRRDEPRNIIGAISIFDGRFYSKEEFDQKSILNIPDKAALVRLYHEMFPKKENWFIKLFRRICGKT